LIYSALIATKQVLVYRHTIVKAVCIVMRYKIVVLCILVMPFLAFSVEPPGESAFEQTLDHLEAAVGRAEQNSAWCQQSTSWHFPARLYNYIYNARICYQKGNKKQLKKAKNYLSLFENTVDLAIEGQSGYWSGNANNVWIDPILPAPECAMDVFIELKAELSVLLSLSSDEVLVLSPESFQ